MSFEIIFVFILLAAALFLFSTNFVSFDVASIILLVCLLASGVLTPEDAFSGVSNPATITIAAMFVISEGIRRTGILNEIGNFFCNKMKERFWLWLFAMLLFVSFASAFMNNTAVIMIFIPVVIDIASRIGISPSKLLIPLSFAAIMGGINTLIGTSTNLLVSSIVSSHGGDAFTMFDFAPMGLIFLGGGFIYMYFFGVDFIPARREKEGLTKGFNMQEFLTDLRIKPHSNLAGKFLDEEGLTSELDLDVLRVFKPESQSSAQRTQTKLEAGDVLRIRGSASEIDKLLHREDLSLEPSPEWEDIDMKQGMDTLVEAAVAPESTLDGQTLGNINFSERFGAIPLAIRHHGDKLQQEELSEVTISGGDTLLLSLSTDRLRDINNDPNFVISSEVDVMRPRTNKTYTALAILAGVVGVAAFDLASIVISAPAGVVLMILTGCLSSEEAYKAINWKVIMLLVGVLPLGIAMNETGAANLMANSLITLLQSFGPVAIVAGLYLLTMLLTAVISVNASVVLLAPIVFNIASQINVNATPLVLTVSYAACLTFITPFGHHANTLIYGPGQYKFTDFTKVGLPLNIIFWILATIFIPIIWPF